MGFPLFLPLLVENRELHGSVNLQGIAPISTDSRKNLCSVLVGVLKLVRGSYRQWKEQVTDGLGCQWSWLEELQLGAAELEQLEQQLRIRFHGSITNIFESNVAVSQTIALGIIAVVQMTIDEVKQTTQQQVNRALRDQWEGMLANQFRPEQLVVIKRGLLVTDKKLMANKKTADLVTEYVLGDGKIIRMGFAQIM
ncbi:hypothetical protein F0562_015314 [Nyssa sinensis]|uniref:Uncharacterized protein n=1 Tax=Nyssa sinensis TaxID=561372 RepID=A0A5J4ZH24_9ASTE|nr:hypothetical protein F0562_015314 [Nyssa sinensis]